MEDICQPHDDLLLLLPFLLLLSGGGAYRHVQVLCEGVACRNMSDHLESSWEDLNFSFCSKLPAKPRRRRRRKHFSWFLSNMLNTFMMTGIKTDPPLGKELIKTRFWSLVS